MASQKISDAGERPFVSAASKANVGFPEGILQRFGRDIYAGDTAADMFMTMFFCMTKKVGHILERIADEENLRLAVRNSQRGGKAKRSRMIREFNKDVDGNVAELRRMILDLDFPEHNARKLTRRADKGKIRDLDDEDYMPWKIMSHAIMQVVEPIVNRTLIADTSCCIKKRGCLYGVRRVRRMLRRNPEYGWFSQSDCKKYYQSIDPEYLERALRHKFKDERFIRLMRICVLDHYSGDVIEKELEDERAKKERSANWRVHKRDDRQSQPQRDRPHHDGEVSRQAPPQLRRYGHAGAKQGGGEVPAQRLRQAGGGEGDRGEIGQFLRSPQA